ncbi:hypothetical protein GOALK_086_00380 [Gordonia alkanivorans NBRC 16433]|uniref:Uncharacterized protein n=1 Tax=Gordonia alkanivorans NBRC 16433 TaxID=1027371 RepID=F9VYA7_9ACTN|nr:hypothetical protein GOALK_086_00380 [Gordonia alkanivorans NBRC 16433]
MDLRVVGQVSPGVHERIGGDVGSVHLHTIDGCGDCGGDRRHSAERLEDNGSGPPRRGVDGFLRQQQGSLPRHEHTEPDAEPEVPELDPPQQMFEWFARDPACAQVGEFVCTGGVPA